jgi:hypothetical protein
VVPWVITENCTKHLEISTTQDYLGCLTGREEHIHAFAQHWKFKISLRVIRIEEDLVVHRFHIILGQVCARVIDGKK